MLGRPGRGLGAFLGTMSSGSQLGRTWLRRCLGSRLRGRGFWGSNRVCDEGLIAQFRPRGRAISVDYLPCWWTGKCRRISTWIKGLNFGYIGGKKCLVLDGASVQAGAYKTQESQNKDSKSCESDYAAQSNAS